MVYMCVIENQEYRVSAEFFEVNLTCVLQYRNQSQVTSQQIKTDAISKIQESVESYCLKSLAIETTELHIEVIEHTGLGLFGTSKIPFQEVYEQWGRKSQLKVIHQTVRIRQEVAELRCNASSTTISSPDVAVEIVSPLMRDDDRESMMVLMLNTKNQVIGIHQASVGSINSSVVHPREILKSAILNNASSILLFHSHPSGNLQESREDVEATQRMVECCKLMGIHLIDHIILGFNNPNYNSLKQKGFI